MNSQLILSLRKPGLEEYPLNLSNMELDAMKLQNNCNSLHTTPPYKKITVN